MKAELAHLQRPFARWQFAVGCARVALFPPRRGGFLMDDRMKHWLTTCGMAALFSLLLVGLLSFMEFFFPPQTQAGGAPSSVLPFFRNWLVLTCIFTPIVSGLRSGQSMTMKHWLIPVSAAVLFGLLLIAPFAWMEWSNNPRIQSGEFKFPFALFFGLWLMPVVFYLGATPIVRSLRAGEAILAHPVALLLRVVLLGFVAIGWVNLVRDQMPCFLGGVPGCD
jgi:hypothetical protein